MHVPLLDLQAQYATIASEISGAIDAVVKSQRFILGPNLEALEGEIAKSCQIAHAVGVASGSDALLLALMAIGIGRGDEVITTPYTFFATAAAVVRLGATPVLVDIDPSTLNLDVTQVAARVTSRTRAVLPVHLFGQCADMTLLVALARQHDLVIIEDAAQAIGAEYCLLAQDSVGEKPAGVWSQAGTMGQLGCLSFYPSKALGAYGDAGMVLSHDAVLAARVRALRTHGGITKYQHDLLGVNSRLDELQAAVLRVKLRYLALWTAVRQANAARYDRLFQEAGLAARAGDRPGDPPVVLPVVAPGRTHTFYVYAIRARQRDRLRDHLAAHGVGTEVYYPIPLHLQPCFAALRYGPRDFPEAEQAAQESLALPMFPELTEAQQLYVVEQIATFYRGRT
jgi:dTDP-4-amino-4,6-dideoxygalactose transaminase